jgi:hypothetical protein
VFNEDMVPQNLINVTSISRTKRVAFLVDLKSIDNDNINEIIRYSITTWGGRYHAIIPASKEEIKPSWWNLLIHLDPDIIYSLLTLDDKLIERINRHILPAKIIEHDVTQDTKPHRISTFDIRALGIEDIPRFIWKTREKGPFFEPHFFYIKEASKDNINSKSFVLRNFGTFPEVVNFTSNALFPDMPHIVIDPGEMNPIEILSDIFEKDSTKLSRSIMPIDHCRMYASRNYSLEFDSFVRGFHLVVGDHPMDAIYSWNRALNSEFNIGRDVFWLSEAHSKEDALLQVLSKWIQRTFWGSDNIKYGKVISYSADISLLQSVAEKMQNYARFSFQADRLNPDSFPLPNAREYFYSPNLFESDTSRQLDKVALSENKGFVRFQRPQFLLKGHPQFGWMVDLEIEYHPERYSSWTNTRPIWRLPKRLGLASKFFAEHPFESRIIKRGLPSIGVTTQSTNIHIRIPSDYGVIWTWFERYSNRTRMRALDPPIFRGLRISDKGKYLQGLLRLFGNVYHAGSAFEDPYWRNVLLLLSGRPNFKDDLELRKKRAFETLNDILDKNELPIKKGSPEINQIAEELARCLTLRDYESRVLTKKQLVSNFAKFRVEGLKKDPNDGYWNTYYKFDENKERDLQDSLKDKILLQGAELSCPHCGSRHWYVVDDLRSDMRCNGCLFGFPLVDSPEWSFRLNDLVTNALRRHGILAVLQTLYKQQQMLNEMFLFLPCQDIFKKTNGEEPFTDLDIVVIKEGKFIIGEVKSDPGGFKQSDFDDLKVVGIDLVPDEIVLAAPGDSWPNQVLKEANKLAEDLKPLEIKVSPLLLQW